MTEPESAEDDSGRVRRILDAAHAVFLEQGYAGTTMDAVARNAGVSKATLYVYFDGKDALFTAMVERARRRLSEAVRGITTSTGTAPLERLRRAGLEFLRFVVSPSALTLFRAVIAETQRFPLLGGQVFNLGRNEILDVFADALRHCDTSGALRIPDPEEAARQFLALVKSDLHLRCLLEPGLLVTEERLDQNVDSALALLRSHYRPG
jgi:AcrR family transcriptional regulator